MRQFRNSFWCGVVVVWAGVCLAHRSGGAEIKAAHEVGEPTFRNHVQSVLTKSGCNMGACHGAAAGKNGLYLSLRGYNDEADWLARWLLVRLCTRQRSLLRLH